MRGRKIVGDGRLERRRGVYGDGNRRERTSPDVHLDGKRRKGFRRRCIRAVGFRRYTGGELYGYYARGRRRGEVGELLGEYNGAAEARASGSDDELRRRSFFRDGGRAPADYRDGERSFGIAADVFVADQRRTDCRDRIERATRYFWITGRNIHSNGTRGKHGAFSVRLHDERDGASCAASAECKHHRSVQVQNEQLVC